MGTCPKCSLKIPFDATLCPKCGLSVSGIVTSSKKLGTMIGLFILTLMGIVALTLIITELIFLFL